MSASPSVLLTALLLAPLAALHAGETSQVTLVAEPARAELATERQKLVFTRTDDGFVLSTFVRDGHGWRAMFDGGRPLLAGPLFDLRPTGYVVLTDAPDRKTIEFFLHQSARAAKPSGMEALDTMIRTFAPLHPADSQIPCNRLTGAAAKWEQVARQAMADLSVPQTMTELAAPWHDEPLELVPAQDTMLVHPSAQAWDFSTVNNHLTPWLLLARLRGDAAALQLGLQKTHALPRFYDPRSRLIRHGTRQPAHVGDLEMSWQISSSTRKRCGPHRRSAPKISIRLLPDGFSWPRRDCGTWPTRRSLFFRSGSTPTRSSPSSKMT